MAGRLTLPSIRGRNTKGTKVGRHRLDISKDKGFPARFAQRLRSLMDDKGWSSGDVAAMVSKGGLPIAGRAVDAWLRGQRLPKLKDIERVGRALGFDDYRDLLPVPQKRSKAKSG